MRAATAGVSDVPSSWVGGGGGGGLGLALHLTSDSLLWPEMASILHGRPPLQCACMRPVGRGGGSTAGGLVQGPASNIQRHALYLTQSRTHTASPQSPHLAARPRPCRSCTGRIQHQQVLQLVRDGAQDDGLADQGLPQPIVLCELEQGRERYVATGSDGWAPSPPPLLGLVYMFLSGTPLSGCALRCTSP